MSSGAVSGAQCFHVYEGCILVLTVWDEPGSLRSTAGPPPGGMPISEHPFLDAQAWDAASEHELREVLLAAKSFGDCLRRLVDAGYDLSATEAFELGPGHRLVRDGLLVGAVWRRPGRFACLWWSPEDQGPSVSHATLTAYSNDHAVELRDLAVAAGGYPDLLARLRGAGYTLELLGRPEHS